jgi:hypothetical protein
MISNTSPSGIASASNIYSSDYDAFKVFDNIITGDIMNGWVTSVNTTNAWLSYEFTTLRRIQKYTIRVLGDSYTDTAPKNWTFEGWDGSKWVIIDTRVNITGWIGLEKKEFTFINNNFYIKYRINVSSNNGAVNIGICELEMMEVVEYFLLKQNSNYYTIKSSNYDSATTHNFMPLTLTGGTTPNSSDIANFGFNDLSVLTNSTTVSSDTFIPILKFDNTAELKLYKPN